MFFSSICFVLFNGQIHAQGNLNDPCGNTRFIKADPNKSSDADPTILVIPIIPGARNVIYVAFQTIPDQIIILLGGKQIFTGEVGSDCNYSETAQCVQGPLEFSIDTFGIETRKPYTIPYPFVFQTYLGLVAGGVGKFIVDTPLDVCELTIKVLPNKRFYTIMWVHTPCPSVKDVYSGNSSDTTVCYGSKIAGVTVYSDTTVFVLPNKECENPTRWSIKIKGQKIKTNIEYLCDEVAIKIDSGKNIKEIFWDNKKNYELVQIIPFLTKTTLKTVDNIGCVFQRDFYFENIDNIFEAIVFNTIIIKKSVKKIELPMVPKEYGFSWKPALGGIYENNKKYFVFTKDLDSYLLPCEITNRLGCSRTIYFKIERHDLGRIFVPNVFSPNGDGVNDKIKPFTNPEVVLIKYFRIFDRFGELVYSKEGMDPHDIHEGWDGTFRNIECMAGVYVWVLEYATIFSKDKEDVLYGDITLLR